MNCYQQLLNNQLINTDIQDVKNNQCEKKIENGEFLFDVNIDIGQGVDQVIQIYDNSNVDKLAEDFCETHNLDKRAIPVILESVNKQKTQILQKQKEFQDQQQQQNQQQQQSQFKQENLSQQQYQHKFSYQNQTINNPTQNQFQNQNLIPVQNQTIKQMKTNYSQKELVNPFHAEYNNTSINKKQQVFEKLYSEAELRNQKLLQRQIQEKQQYYNNEKSMTRSQSAKRYLGNKDLSVGEYLYYNGMRQKEIKNQQIEKQKELLKQQQEQQYQKSQIKTSSKSQQILQKKGIPFQDYKNILLQQSQKKKELIKQQIVQQQSNQCSFKPLINDISQKISEQKLKQNPRTNVFENLYQQSQLQQQQQSIQQSCKKSIQESYSFTPQINKKPSFGESQFGGIPFLERMQKSIEERKIREMIQPNQPQLVDEATGQQFFKPIIGRTPKYQRNPDNLPIGQYLYQIKDDLQKKQKTLLIQDEIYLKSQVFKSDNKSGVIMEQKLVDKLIQIFNCLDSDGDGKISTNCIDIKKLSTNVIEIISPLLCEMEQLNAEYDLEQFLENAFILYKSLNITDKNKLIFDSNERCEKLKAEEEKKYTFQPQINKNSKQLITKKQQENLGQNDLYSRGLQFNQEKDLRMQKEKQLQRESEVSDCTFKPLLCKPMNIYKFNENQSQTITNSQIEEQNKGNQSITNTKVELQ